MIMPESHRPSAEAFAIDLLRTEPNLDYSTLRERAREMGISMQPIHYGRARKQLGLPALRDSRPEPVARSESRLGEAIAPVEALREAADPVAPRKKGSPAFDFLVQELRREPSLLYAELRD